MIVGRRRVPSCEAVALPVNPVSTEVPVMLRTRWAVAVLAGGLGLVGGCSSLRDHPWFSRGRVEPAAAPCCESPAGPFAEGPIMDGGPPVGGPPVGGPPIVAPPPPNGALPPGVDVQPPATDGTIRPVPQAQPIPAQPSRRTPGLIIDRWRE
jgi:hypothetical protein